VTLTYDPVTLTFVLVTVNMCSVSAVTWSHSVQNLSEIEQFATELLRFQYITK